MKSLRNRMIILYSITTMVIVVLLTVVFNISINKILREHINEVTLVSKLNQAIFWIGGIFLLIAIIIVVIIAIFISKPITRVIEQAKMIATGKYDVQIEGKSSMKELEELVYAINEMSFALKKEELLKSQMCKDIAHELRTPLCNLQGQVEAMIDGLWEPTKVRLERCHTEILRLTSLVNQLQELYVLENISDSLYMSEFNFYDLCCRLQSEFEKRINDKKIIIQLQVPEDATIYGDVQRIKQCMFNLISNAITYSLDEKVILISYWLEGMNELVIQVTDNGQGISQEEIGLIFERFYRVDKSRNLETGGMGIGLSICKTIIERHNGTITVKSEVGTGTTFEIRLPI